MDIKIDKDEETIALLRKEIKLKEKDLKLAASFGNQLIADKEKIQSKLLELQYRVECLEQEKYSLQLNLETQVQSVRTQNSEIEYQLTKNDELQRKVKECEKELAVQRQKYNIVFGEKSDLESQSEDLKLKNSSLKNKIKFLEQQVSSLEEKAKDLKEESKIEQEIPDINLYTSRCKELQDALAKMQYELEETKLRENKLSNTVKELEEAVADRDKELRSYSLEIQKAKEFSSELQCEIEVLKLEQVDVNRRGNSMFSELDDRRKIVENEYKQLRQKYHNILKNYEANKEELTRCKGQMSVLVSMTSKKYQDVYIEKLESMLSAARREIETLTLKLEKATKDSQKRANQVEPVSGDKYNYLRIMNQQAQEKIKILQNELVTSRLQLNTAENNILESNQNIYKARSEIHELKIDNLKLKQEIKDFVMQPDSSVPEKKQIVEKMPGFQSNILCQTLTHEVTDTKENDSNSWNTHFHKSEECVTFTQLNNSSSKEVKGKSEQTLHSCTYDVSEGHKKNVNCAQQ